MLATLLGCAVFLAMMAGLFIPLEHFAPARAVPAVTTRQVLIALGLFVLNTFLMQWFGGPLLAVLQAATTWVPRRPSAPMVLLVFLLADLCGYVMHRAMHRVPWLWKFHSVHHRATDATMTWLDAWRQHPLDFVLHGLAVGVPGALLGASLSDVASVVVLRKAFTTWLHANVRLQRDVARVLGWFLATPEFHTVHHSADPRLYDTNFAGTFPLWDRVFGTHAHLAQRKPTLFAASSSFVLPRAKSP